MDATVELKRRRFSVKDYHRMVEAGILRVFASRLGERVIVRIQGPIVLASVESEPEPDVALLVPRADFYTTGHPEPADVLLAVEVMDTSVDKDRRVKLPLYARAGIAETWLVDRSVRLRRVSRAGRRERSPARGPDGRRRRGRASAA